MTFLRDETCEGCQKKIEVYEIQVIGGEHEGEWIEWRKGCVCEDIKLAEQAERNHQNMKHRKTQDFFNSNSLISKDLEKASFDNYNPNNDLQNYAKRVSQKYAKVFSLERPRNLSFHGSFGLGKSHLAKSIADEVMKKGFTAIFISVPKLLRKIKSTYANDSKINEDDIITMLEEVDLLVLDDLGAEKKSDWVTERIFDIIDSRQGCNTIYTTNFKPEDLVNKLGERNFSRVVNQDTTIVEIEGENNRLKDLKGGED